MRPQFILVVAIIYCSQILCSANTIPKKGTYGKDGVAGLVFPGDGIPPLKVIKGQLIEKLSEKPKDEGQVPPPEDFVPAQAAEVPNDVPAEVGEPPQIESSKNVTNPDGERKPPPKKPGKPPSKPAGKPPSKPAGKPGRPNRPGKPKPGGSRPGKPSRPNKPNNNRPGKPSQPSNSKPRPQRPNNRPHRPLIESVSGEAGGSGTTEYPDDYDYAAYTTEDPDIFESNPFETTTSGPSDSNRL